jgi:ribonuclease Z
MSLAWKILGRIETDNALFVRVNAGQANQNVLFDCGEGCLLELEFGDVLALDHVCFSHFHADHVGGFDSLLRARLNSDKALQIWGPAGSIELISHRLQGILWNLTSGLSAPWTVHEIHESVIYARTFQNLESFKSTIPDNENSWNNTILETAHFRLQVRIMDHGTPSLAYRLSEPERINLDTSQFASLGLQPGAWVKAFKDAPIEQTELEINGNMFDLELLRARLLLRSAGEAIAYLTDFKMNDAARLRLESMLQAGDILVCESQYLHRDLELAIRNDHMTNVQAATLAFGVQAKQLVLFHISRRYPSSLEWQELLLEAQKVFGNTMFSSAWKF